MALAKYFSKNLLAINQLISINHKKLESILISKTVTIAFDENAVNTYEGNCGLDLIIRLLSRLYPKIKIIDLSKKNESKKKELFSLAKKVNKNIDIMPENSAENIYIVVGFTKEKIESDGKIIYFGSDNWISKYSISRVQNFENSENPFGCGVSACIVASNVFRCIFKEFTEIGKNDEEVELNTFTLDSESNSENPIFNEVIFKDVTLVGLGAVGNGTLWALSKLNQLSGVINLVDHETISLSNMQRYVTLYENDKDKYKVNLAKNFIKKKNLKVKTIVGKWDEYVVKRNDWNIDCVAIGIDNEKDRIGIQSTLPKVIFNSFTEKELIGINRHYSLVEDACLACSYIPTNKKRHRINEIADNCNIPDLSEMIKEYFNSGILVDQILPPKHNSQNKFDKSLLTEISNANSIEISQLSQFNGMNVDQFYSDFVCGGVIMKLSKSENKVENIDAPLAFQSALAGILLAAELVKYSIHQTIKIEQRTDFYHLQPILKDYNPLNRILVKNDKGNCICGDKDFIKRYQEKWKVK